MYKLGRQTLVGTQSFISEEVSGIFPMITFTGSTPDGYTDVTTFDEWHNYFEKGGDNLLMYNEIRNQFIENELQYWGTMSATSSISLMKNYVHPKGVSQSIIDSLMDPIERELYLHETINKLEYSHNSSINSDNNSHYYYHSFSDKGYPYTKMITPYETLNDYCCDTYGVELIGGSYSNYTIKPYKILHDVKIMTDDFQSINYRIGLKSGVAYTPVYTVHNSGTHSGLLEKTDYYKDFVDAGDMGELILSISEEYTIDHSDLTLNWSARPTTSRIKTWSWVDGDGNLDTINTKTKTKLYDTRKKRHVEGMRRRENIVEQLIDNVGLAGVLTGTFADEPDAHEKLTLLTEVHANAFTGWRSSGRGSLIGVVENDTETTWLGATVSSNPYVDAMCPWMIGYTFRSYIKEKLKGNIR